MQEQLRLDIQALMKKKMALQREIEEIDTKIHAFQSLLVDEPWPDVNIPVLEPDEKDAVVGNGDPPVEGAIPAITYRDKDGHIRIQLCRTYAGEGWIYTPVADGWITITHEDA